MPQPDPKKQLADLALRTFFDTLRDYWINSQAEKRGVTFEEYCKAQITPPRGKTPHDYIAEQIRPLAFNVYDSASDIAESLLKTFGLKS